MMEDLNSTKLKILEFVKRNGPVLPVQISRQIESDIIFAGAVMSELVKHNQLKISHAKIGGSPVYYVDGQEFKLQRLYDHLNEKERKAYDLLKKKNVLMDSKLEPWQRVAFRELKDFATMLKINTGEVFWKWYLLSNSEAEPLIKSILKIKPVKPVEVKKEKPKRIEKQVKRRPKKLEEDTIIDTIAKYFIKKNAKILKHKVIKKNKEVDLTVKAPSELGDVKFFVKFLDKKKVNDADLSLAHNKAQLRKMPLLVLTNGDLTKKALQYKEKNYLVFEKILL